MGNAAEIRGMSCMGHSDRGNVQRPQRCPVPTLSTVGQHWPWETHADGTAGIIQMFNFLSFKVYIN